MSDDRKKDKLLTFIDISNDDLVTKNRIENAKLTDIENAAFINLNSAFEKTEPIVDHHVENVLPFMCVRRSTKDEELPEEIRFLIPNIDLPAQLDDGTEVTTTVKRYVCLDSMPTELQSVVRNWLALKSNHGSCLKSTSKVIFRDAVRLFAASVEKHFNSLDDKDSCGAHEPRVPTLDELKSA